MPKVSVLTPIENLGALVALLISNNYKVQISPDRDQVTIMPVITELKDAIPKKNHSKHREFKKLTDIIYDYMETGKLYSFSEIAEFLSTTKYKASSASSSLTILYNKGLLDRIQDKRVYWYSKK